MSGGTQRRAYLAVRTKKVEKKNPCYQSRNQTWSMRVLFNFVRCKVTLYIAHGR